MLLTPEQIQHQEQRSIAIHKHCAQSLPVSIDRTVFQKTAAEKREVKQIQSNFKRNGLAEWKERNKL